MQSWGGPVAGDDRPSLDVPTKSGVIGLIAGALGIDRREVDRLASLHASYAFAVRVDRRGTPGVDYHTTLDVPTAEGGKRNYAVISKRRYLHDSAFSALLVVRAKPTETLDGIVEALRHPAFVPFLGRRACPPSVPVVGRSPCPIEGADWRGLFDQVPLDPGDDVPPLDVHLDAELAPEAIHRPRRQRDVLMGRMPRLFGERVVHVTRWTPPEGKAKSSAPRVEESIDEWFR